MGRLLFRISDRPLQTLIKLHISTNSKHVFIQNVHYHRKPLQGMKFNNPENETNVKRYIVELASRLNFPALLFETVENPMYGSAMECGGNFCFLYVKDEKKINISQLFLDCHFHPN